MMSAGSHRWRSKRSSLNSGSAEMPKAERLVLCGGAQAPRRSGGESLSLNLHGPSSNVYLKISDISRKLLTNIPDRLVDLLEIASYIYAADSALSRGGR